METRMRRQSGGHIHLLAGACFTSTMLAGWVALAQEHSFTSDADFDQGTLLGVNHEAVHDQLQLDARDLEFPFVWVAKTGRKTIVRLDANTGQIVGEYRTAPDGRAGNPSRTAVDRFGNVWVGNRSEAASGRGSVAKIGLVLGGTRGRKNADGSFTPDPGGGYLAPPFHYSTAVDRDGDGLIRTSRALGDILPWVDLGDGLGGMTAEVTDAADECILLYQRTSATDVQHLAMAPDERVWVGGFVTGPTGFDVLDPATGRILQSMLPACGGYGGVIDAQGVLWSAAYNQSSVLRYDTVTGSTSCVPVPWAAGIAVDAQGYAWCSMWDRNAVAKLTADGSMVAGFPKQTGGGDCYGIAITPDGDVWVANKRTNDVSRLDSAGNLRKRIAVGLAPTGVAVDANGRVWVVNQNSHNVVRLDPAGGSDGLGVVDLVVLLGSGAAPINYGSMTGIVRVREVEAAGSWTVRVDGGRAGLDWSRVAWGCEEPGTSRIEVHVRAADRIEALDGQSWRGVASGADLMGTGVQGQFLQLRASFQADLAAHLSPVLHDIRVAAQANTVPDCATAAASIDMLWPPDGRMVEVQIASVTDPDGDAVTCRVTRILQDEPVRDRSGARRGADARGVGSATAHLRAERDGNGSGRVYTIVFEASDGRGGVCEGRVKVCVPHDMKRKDCGDEGELYDATLEDEDTLETDNYPNPFNPRTTIRYSLPAAVDVQLVVYDALGRRVRTLVAAGQNAGAHDVSWDGSDDAGRQVPSGVYVYHLRAGSEEVSRRMLLLK